MMKIGMKYALMQLLLFCASIDWIVLRSGVQAAIQGQVEISDATVSASSSYTFEMYIDQGIPLGGLI